MLRGVARGAQGKTGRGRARGAEDGGGSWRAGGRGDQRAAGTQQWVNIDCVWHSVGLVHHVEELRVRGKDASVTGRRRRTGGRPGVPNFFLEKNPSLMAGVRGFYVRYPPALARVCRARHSPLPGFQHLLTAVQLVLGRRRFNPRCQADAREYAAAVATARKSCDLAKTVLAPALVLRARASFWPEVCGRALVLYRAELH